MEKSTIDRERTVVAHNQASEVSQPGIGAFHDPAPFVAPQGSSVLGCRSNPIPLVRTDQFDAALAQRLRNRSLSYALSAITRTGFCRGLPL